MVLGKHFPHTVESSRENARKDLIFMIKFFGFLTYTALTDFKFISVVHYNPQYMRLWSLVNSSYFPMSMYYFYSILLFDVVHLELKGINKDLKNLICFVEDKKDYKCCDRFDNYVSGRITLVQSKYSVICSMVEDLNQIFGWSWTLSVLSSTIVHYCSIYWFYHGLHRKDNYAGVGKY
ncbi:unnamed protein product [Hermetia illucens]|uniref:Uncharacterized protein n=1 Tax=Hermetia illucens TaxID=343691 RepID=A0A7R8UTP4_HERIL|nr:unnamed protein product [Hermetia illucens]